MTGPHRGDVRAREPESALPPPGVLYPPKKRFLIWGLIILALLGLTGMVVWGIRCQDLLWGGVCYYRDYLGEKENIKRLLQEAGPLGPLAFIIVQFLQVVFAPIPGEATGFLGGFLFGIPLGMLYSTIGLTLGSVAAFLLGRWLEEHFVVRIVRPETLQRFDFLMERQGALVAFFLFLIPGFPKDYLCFILGLSTMPLRLFILMVTLGRLPGTLMLTLQGAKVYEGEYLLTAVLLGLCLVVGGVMLYYRERLYHWIKNWESPAKAP